MLVWNKELWLIDHGASLYFHCAPENWELKAAAPFLQVKSHVLLSLASQLEQTDRIMHTKLNAKKLQEIVALISDEWLDETGHSGSKET